jgi:tetratricopeptide (TPR) repeat protein
MNTRGTFWRYTFLAAGSIFLTAIAAGQPAADPVERSMRFVDQSLKATELFNAGKPDQALPIFQDLLKQDQDLDEDGYVAISIGDCLTALGRTDQARLAYQQAAKLHPDLQPKIDQHLIELALKGKITDDMIAKLRIAAKANKETQFNAGFQLGRALIKKATQLLTEAAETIQATVKAGGPFGDSGYVQNQPAILNEWITDMKSFSDRLDKGLGKPTIRLIEEEKELEVNISKQQWRWETDRQGKPTVSFVITVDKTGKLHTTANGKPLILTAAQQRLLQHHQQRINAIILEAADKPTTKTKQLH